jgi:hypothetical protein
MRETAKVVAFVVTALAAAAVRAPAVAVPAVAPEPAAVQDAEAGQSQARTVLVGVKVAAVGARIPALPIRRNDVES